MAIKDDFVLNIRRNEIRIRKKEKKTKDATITTTSSKSSVDDEEFTLLLKTIVKKLKKKNKKANKKQLKHGNVSNFTKDDEVKCNVCKQLFSKKYFTIHMQSHKASYKCEICDKKFSYLSIFNRHKATHKHDKVVYECKLCDKTFKNISKHDTFHKQEIIKCLFCFKTFKQFDDFLDHLNMYSFDKHSKSLTNHIKIHSEGVHCLSCCICKMSFAERDTIIKYIM